MRTPNPNGNVQLQVTVPAALEMALEAYCERDGYKKSALVAKAVAREIGYKGPKKPKKP